MNTKETMKQKTLDKFMGKVLIEINFKCKKPELFVDDLKDLDRLLYYIDKIETQEASLTDDGLAFLEEYYGLDELAKQLLHHTGISFSTEKYKNALIWLRKKGEVKTEDWEAYDRFLLGIQKQFPQFVEAMNISNEDKDYSHMSQYFQNALQTFLSLHSAAGNEKLLKSVSEFLANLFSNDCAELRYTTKYFFFDDLEEASSKDPSLKQYLP